MNELRSKHNRKLAPVLLGQLLGMARGYYDHLEKSIRLKENEYGLKHWKPFL